MIKRKINVIITSLTLVILFSSITNTSAASSVTLDLTFTNLADPGVDHYEGWLIIDGSPVSTGKFSVDGSGNIVDLTGASLSSFDLNVNLDKATKFVLTLELNGDTDSSPSAIKLIAGDLNADKTSAILKHNVGVDFSAISGSYILATPTNGADTDENSGIWFLDPTGTDVAAGLSLPDLTNTDWTYEGWVVINGIPVTTGTFNMGSGADATDPYSGSTAGPPFPGEDFLNNAPSGLTFPTDLAGMTAVISIEPRMDNSVTPFQFKPLIGSIATDAVDHTLYLLDDMSATLPTGNADLSVNDSNDDSLPGLMALEVIIAFSAILLSYKMIRRVN